jgi:quinol monooxygenase YgiN
MSQTLETYLLAIHGKLAPKTLEAAREVHNRTAGAPQNVAVARSLGDLSHMVYIPVDHSGPEAGEFLVLDQWNNLDGINQFFANPTVQEQAGQIFVERDPVVWKPAEGLITYHFPAPADRKDRIIGVVRGLVRSQADALKMHNALVGSAINKARAAGNMSHEPFFRMAAPGSPEALEFFAVDVWFDAAGMQKHYEDPEFMKGFMQMFTAEPMATIWVHPAGEWVEW